MIVYKYGALKPIVGFELLLQQLRDANNYRNSALELALTRKAALFCGADEQDVRTAYNDARRELYASFSTAGLLGHRTLYHLDAAAKKSAAKRWKCWSKTGRFKSPYRRFDGTGFVAANSQLRVEAFAKLAPTGKRRAICELRTVGERIIAVPITLDRHLPAGADLADARLHVNRVGDRWVYHMTFTVRNEGRASTRSRGRGPREERRGEGACAINFGWRVVDGGVRIATVAGPDGADEASQLILPRALVDARKHAESLGALADETAASFLGSSRGRHRARRETLRGKGPSPLSLERFVAGDPKNEVDREHWARRDRHLWQWECDERAKMQRQREEIFRLWVRRLRAKYGSVTIESYSMADLARSATTPETPRMTAARHVRFLVAPSYLRAEVVRVFGEDCTDANKGKRTKRCHVCRKMCSFDAAEELAHECEHCGASWDQDANNAVNQLLDTAAE